MAFLSKHRAASEATYQELSKQLHKLPESARASVEQVWTTFGAAPSTTRHLILAGLLNQCCIPQLSFLHRSVPPLLRVDFIALTPPQVAFKILSYLDATTLCRAAQVSKTWQEMADDDRLWHHMCEQHIDRKCTSCGWGLPPLAKKRRRCEVTDHELIRTNQTGQGGDETMGNGPTLALEPAVVPPTGFSNVCSPTGVPAIGPLPPSTTTSPERPSKRQCTTSVAESTTANSPSSVVRPSKRPWKLIYSERLKLERNWRRGQYRLRVLEGHTDGVLCLQFDDEYIMSGSYDSTIKIWNSASGALIRSLRGHTRGVRALQFDQVKLISGSMDGTVKIWNYRSGQCLRTLPVGDSGVNCLHFDQTLLAAGSVDGTISVFNFQSGATTQLTGHTDWVNGVRILSSTELLSCSDDTTIRLWNLDTRTCIREFVGHVGHVQTFQLATHPWKLPISLQQQQPAASSSPHLGATAGATHFTGTAADGHESRHTASSSVSSTSSATVPRPLGGTFTANVFVTGGLDSTLKVWDIDSGRCLDTLFGHTEGIWSVALDSLRIVSASHDSTIKVWDTQSRQCLQTLRDHEGPVNCVALSDTRVISGGIDHKIRIWDFGLEDETQAAV
ncbi:quinon protein alcohol dehydrogenase-like superfamily [Dimargaris cristalligena]|uniref:Quinon protein alcohol dehydrogenase-like superfamily n=1 Tax=Dimargaris cristalligena TaxID=215637 RepID=A0A4P9ZQZ7_9FUNG|nr:quinon protein alcohol dehydrogenase-like superfamily [Dimargaris cristalligena]|eukprot:RKP35926.1 quinon protein alcohol dehydrogenase-like superfamily [Dimargaris cristalligena]